MKNSPHFLSVIKNEDVIKHCGEVLGTLDATCNNIKKLDDLSAIPVYTKFNGMILDVPSLFKLSGLDRAFLKVYASGLPTLKFVWNIKINSMMVTQTSLDNGVTNDFTSFVKKCKLLPACAVRRERRYDVILNATLNKHQVNISNISNQGCFILTVLNSFQLGDEISIVVKEFTDQTPVPCIIHRRVDWGCKEKAAGIGVEFLSLKDTQRSELEAMLAECAQKMVRELEMSLY